MKFSLKRIGSKKAYTALLKENQLLKQQVAALANNVNTAALPNINSQKSIANQKVSELKKLSVVVEQSPSSIVISDLNGNIEYVNPAFVQVTGYSPSEVIGKNPSMLQSGKTDAEVYRVLWKTVTAGNVWKGEFINKNKNGIEYWEKAIVSPIINNEGLITSYISVKEDISEQKIAEQSAIENTKKFRAIFENAADGILIGNNKGEIIDANNSICKLSGYSKQELISKHIKILFKNNMLKSKPLDFSALDKGQSIIIKRDICTKNDNVVPIEMNSKRLDTNYYISIIRDLSERKIAEQALKESEERYKMLSNLSMEGIILHDNGIIKDLNSAISEIFGYTKEELLGTNVVTKLATKDTIEIIQEKIDTKNELPYEIEGIKKNGKIFPIEINGRNIKLKNDTLRVASIRDISQRKKMEEILKTSLNLKTLLSNHTEDEIIEWGLKEALRVTKCDIAFFHLISKDEDHLSKQIWLEHNNSEFKFSTSNTIVKNSDSAIWNEAINEKRIVINNNYLRTQDENPLNEETFNFNRFLTIPIIENNKVRAVSGIGSNSENFTDFDADILQLLAKNLWTTTQRLRLENKLINANAAKDKFFSIIAHDLRSPISSINSLSEMLVENFSEYSNEMRINYMRLIADSSKATFNLLENMLEWARTQTNKIVYSPEHIFTHELIDFNVALFKQAADKKNIELSIFYDKALVIMADRNQVNTILRNLISNAIKFTPQFGKVSITASYFNENYAKLCVKDSGIGMNEKEINKLFDISKEFSKSGTENEKGTGLGLTLCKEFTKINCGEIWVTSTPNAGSEFCIKLPLA